MPQTSVLALAPTTGGTSRDARVRRTPLATAEALHAALTARGLNRIYRNGDGRLQVVSVRTGLTVWIGETVYWRDGTGEYRHLPSDDLVAAAEQIIARHEELDVHQDRLAHH